ncbi:MAG: methionine--tRNA ligase, partial [Pseudomonadota bacterium]
KTAITKNIKPKQFVDEVCESFSSLTKTLNLSNDDFIRTTEYRHRQAVSYFWQQLQARGYIYESTYAGWYAIRDEAYYTESELVDGKASTGAAVEWVEEPCYFFALSKFEQKLLDYYANNPDFIYPKSRYNEVVSFVKSGLKDLSISRTTFAWGIPVPDSDSHVIYVWLDALTNYLTVLGYPNNDQKLQDFWPATHIVGKDILRFHAVYWPAMLMALDIELPQQIVAHGWWTNEGEKISKSLGNTIDPVKLTEQYGVDQVRYFLMREMPFGQDGNFSKSAFIARINSELANKLGNLAMRSLSMIVKHFKQQLPEANYHQPPALHQTAIDCCQKLSGIIAKPQFAEYLEQVMILVDQANSFIDSEAPWQYKKSDPAKMGQILYEIAETLRYIAVMLLPFMPESMHKLLDQLAVSNDLRNFAALTPAQRLKCGQQLPVPTAIFPRIVNAQAVGT